MITPYLYAFASVLLVSSISLIGVLALSVKAELLRRYIFIFVSLAVGALLGDAFLHLIPESLENFSNPALPSILIICGIIIFFILEKFLHWHHHGEDAAKPHGIRPIGKLILFSDGVHNLIDGIVIGASFIISIPIGVATTITVILHEIPQEIGDFSVLLYSGYTKNRALRLNFFSALFAVFGVIIAFVLGGAAEFILWILPIAAGGFIYIAVADLIPELHKTKELVRSILQIIAVIIGILIMLTLLFIE